MASNLRFRSSYVLAIALALGACNASSHDTPAEGDGGRSDGGAVPVDAGGPATPDAPGDPDSGQVPGDSGQAPPGDAGSGTSSGAGTPGIVTCYSEGSPKATCTLPVHCCFASYSSQRNGNCSTDACTYGTITCDGPEDCAPGQRCCAHAITDPAFGTIGYTLACQDSACGPAPANQELCQPTLSSAAGTCSSPTRACVTAFGNDNDLPRTLYICQ